MCVYNIAAVRAHALGQAVETAVFRWKPRATAQAAAAQSRRVSEAGAVFKARVAPADGRADVDDDLRRTLRVQQPAAARVHRLRVPAPCSVSEDLHTRSARVPAARDHSGSALDVAVLLAVAATRAPRSFCLARRFKIKGVYTFFYYQRKRALHTHGLARVDAPVKTSYNIYM